MQVTWDDQGVRRFETGVDHGVLYIPDNSGAYTDGVAWNGLTTVTESPSGAEANPQYADNIKYLNLFSAEEFSATLEALTYPDEFSQFDGIAEPVAGLNIGQQRRGVFGLCYRTVIGNDLEGNDYGYKIHLLYGCQASPSERAYSTINDSPDVITFSWAVSTNPVAVPGLKPTSIITVDSTKVDAEGLADLEQILYGTNLVDPRLPLPAEVIALFSGSVATVHPTQPTYNAGTHTITIPAVAGVTYYIDGDPVPAGPLVISEDTVVTARPNAGNVFDSGSDDDWYYAFS